MRTPEPLRERLRRNPELFGQLTRLCLAGDFTQVGFSTPSLCSCMTGTHSLFDRRKSRPTAVVSVTVRFNYTGALLLPMSVIAELQLAGDFALSELLRELLLLNFLGRGAVHLDYPHHGSRGRSSNLTVL